MLRGCLCALLAVTLLGAQERAFRAQPIGFVLYRSGAGLWHPQSINVTLLGYGLLGQATLGRLEVVTEVIGTQFIGISSIPQLFSQEHGFSWQIAVVNSAEEFASDYTSMKLTYRAAGATLFAGKFSRQWGPGLNSIFLSEKSPTFPQFGFELPLTGRLDFTYFHGELFSGIQDTVRAQVGLLGPQRLFLERFMAAHRLEWRPWDQLTLAFSEAVVYGGKGIETMYLMPFILFFSAEHFLGNADNIQMQADFEWRPRPGLTLYGAWFLDDWEVLLTFNPDNNSNHFGWQGGMDWKNLALPGDRLALEATWTDARVYRHQFPASFYENRDYPLGHWIGAHAQAFQVLYAVPLRQFRLQGAYTYARRGQLTEQMLRDQYSPDLPPPPRFEGGSESFQHLAFHLYRQVWRRVWLELGLSHLSWRNAGFDPGAPGLSGEDVSKVSVNMGLYLNFNLPGYSMTTLLRP